MVGIVEQGGISLHRTLEKQFLTIIPAQRMPEIPLNKGKCSLLCLVLASVPCSRLQEASWSRKQSDSLWYYVSHTLLPCSLLCFLVPNSFFLTGE